MPPVKRWNLRVTNHQAGEVWVIADTRARCEKELAKKLAAWGLAEGEATVEWAEADE